MSGLALLIRQPGSASSRKFVVPVKELADAPFNEVRLVHTNLVQRLIDFSQHPRTGMWIALSMKS